MKSLNHYIQWLPQKPPFLFVDEVKSVAYLESAAGSVTFEPGHRIFENHLPGEPLVPGVILIEALAQLSGIVLIPPEGRRAHGYLAEVREMRFRRLVHPGERIDLSTSLERRFGSAASFRASGEVQGEETVSGLLTLGGMAGT